MTDNKGYKEGIAFFEFKLLKLFNIYKPHIIYGKDNSFYNTNIDERRNLTMTTQHFGRIVRDRRERKRYTIAHTAELAGLSSVGLTLIEFGDSDPKLSSVVHLAAALNIDLGELNACKPVPNEEQVLIQSERTKQ